MSQAVPSAGRCSSRGLWDTRADGAIAVGKRHGERQVAGHSEVFQSLAIGLGGASEASRVYPLLAATVLAVLLWQFFRAIKDTMLMLDRMSEAEVAIGAITSTA